MHGSILETRSWFHVMMRLLAKMLTVEYCVPLETVGAVKCKERCGLGEEARSSKKKTIQWWITVGGAAAVLEVRGRAEVCSSVWVTLVLEWASGGISQSQDLEPPCFGKDVERWERAFSSTSDWLTAMAASQSGSASDRLCPSIRLFADPLVYN